MYSTIKNVDSLKEFFIREMAKDIFGNGFGSRLMEIREKYGYAYTIYCDHLFIEPESLLYVYIGLNKENIEKTKELMLEKLNTLISQGITIDELNTAKNCLLTQVKSNKISTSAMNDMRINLLSEHLDFESSIDNMIDIINEITLDDINNYIDNFNNNVGFITLLQTKD
jgi:predicted Zn-dependent peptidase